MVGHRVTPALIALGIASNLLAVYMLWQVRLWLQAVYAVLNGGCL